tara:strand:+ start:712 stop:948 length:237 start_codon:yes stop_codon:yes gene_type:complete
MMISEEHKAKKIEAGVYDYRGFRIVFYEMPNSKGHWYIYKQVEGIGDSCLQGYDATNQTTATLAIAKEYIDCWITLLT